MEQQEQHFRSGFRKPHLPILKKHLNLHGTWSKIFAY